MKKICKNGLIVILTVMLCPIAGKVQAQNVGIGESAPVGILHVSQPGAFAGVAFAGTGLNDLSVSTSGYSGTGSTSYAIRIQNAGPNPNIIEKSSDGGATWSSPVPISNPISLNNGVTASFASTSGHTFGDTWS